MKIVLRWIARILYIALILIFVGLIVGFTYGFKLFLYSNDGWSTFLFVIGLVALLVIGFGIILSIAIGISKIEER